MSSVDSGTGCESTWCVCKQHDRWSYRLTPN